MRSHDQPEAAAQMPAAPPPRSALIQRMAQQPASVLRAQLATQTSRFLAGEPADDLPGLALFWRAIVWRDEDAWAALYQQYAPLVFIWITQQSRAAPLLGQDGSAPLVNAAFAKFAQALTPAKMDHFDSLAALLKYLKLCVQSVLAVEARSRQARQYEETLETIEQEPAANDPADDVVSTISAQGLWQVIQEELHGEDERLLLYLAYAQGMKPSEIRSQYGHLFPSVEEIYRIKRNVLEQLRRNRRLQQFLV